MGSFTSLGARQVITALFPAGVTTVISGAITNINALRIYTTDTTSNSVGVFAHTGSTSGVRHRMDLLQAGGSGGTQISQGLVDARFGPNALNGSHAQTLAAINFANYTNYQGMSMVASAQANHGWLGWNLVGAQTDGEFKVTNNGPIAFPSCGATPNTVCGFVLSAAGTSTGTAANAVEGTSGTTSSATQLLASYSGANGTVMFAYGDLSSFRTISNGDTPVFTTQAISITLA